MINGPPMIAVDNSSVHVICRKLSVRPPNSSTVKSSAVISYTILGWGQNATGTESIKTISEYISYSKVKKICLTVSSLRALHVKREPRTHRYIDTFHPVTAATFYRFTIPPKVELENYQSTDRLMAREQHALHNVACFSIQTGTKHSVKT